MSGDDLPFIDEHRVLVAAPADVVWRTLGSYLASPRFSGSEVYARLVAAEPSRASGTPLAQGSTLPGFRVAEAVPGQRVRLTGRHLFSRYALTLSVTPETGGTTLSALSHAEFPGPHGLVYRGLVIGTGAHRVFVRRLLHSVRKRAEHAG
ncbi:SRPBCC family protein [Actinosynnema sp. NPDC023587]|uniref:SRPBCC family protein n=1 Tax=Actinosynnema sp. NPDC023587 TaxID=3154695 RepID=UPI0033C0259C